jgi:hypothetical protein
MEYIFATSVAIAGTSLFLSLGETQMGVAFVVGAGITLIVELVRSSS